MAEDFRSEEGGDDPTSLKPGTNVNQPGSSLRAVAVTFATTEHVAPQGARAHVSWSSVRAPRWPVSTPHADTAARPQGDCSQRSGSERSTQRVIKHDRGE
jgi:hypothetical protein